MTDFQDFDMEDTISWVIDEWLEKYYVKGLQAGTNHQPSIIASYTDMPFYPQGGFTSTTENSAMKKLVAEEWIKYFHQCLNGLPPLHQEIIEEKYLKRNKGSGSVKLNEEVFLKLNLTSATFYRRQKEALYWLGLALLSNRENFSF